MSEIRTIFHGDGDKFAIERVQDVEDIIDGNKRLQGEAQKSDWGRHVARIPCIFLEQWLNEEFARGNTTITMFGPEMDALVERKLQDPAWKFLRVDNKQVQGFTGFGS